MLRLTELKLPLDHLPEALPAAIVQRLNISADVLLDFSIFKRSHDARKAHAVLLIYSVDVTLKDEAAVLKKLRGERTVMPTPDMGYRFVAHAPDKLSSRPLAKQPVSR